MAKNVRIIFPALLEGWLSWRAAAALWAVPFACHQRLSADHEVCFGDQDGRQRLLMRAVEVLPLSPGTSPGCWTVCME